MPDAPAKCPTCGSAYFFEDEYQPYIATSYSSLPGGDLLPANTARGIASGNTVRVRKCLSGHIVCWPPNYRSLLQDDQKRFEESFNLALARQQALDPQTILTEIQKGYVDKSAFEALVKTVDEMNEAAKTLADSARPASTGARNNRESAARKKK